MQPASTLVLDRYEAARIISDRALLLTAGAPPLLDVPSDDAIAIAYCELVQGRLRFRLTRGASTQYSDEYEHVALPSDFPDPSAR